MARDYHVHRRSRLPLIMELYPLGVTPEEIGLGLKTSPSTIHNQLRALEKKKAFTRRPFKDPDARFPLIFRLYAQVKTEKCTKRQLRLRTELIRILEIALDLPRIEGYLQALDDTFQRLLVPEYAEDGSPFDAAPYLRLLDETLMNRPPESRRADLWGRYLAYAADDVFVPESLGHLCGYLQNDYIQVCRGKIMPIWHLTFNGGAAVHAQLDTLADDEQDVLRRRYGIETKAQTDVEIARDYGVTKTRINQIKNKGLVKLRRKARRRYLEPYVTPVSDAYPAWRGSMRLVDDAAKEKSERLQMAIPTPEEPLPAEVLETFLKSVDILLLSVRSENALSTVGIDLIGDLIQIRPEKLKEAPNCGRKSVEEIQKRLGEMGLSLSTILTETQSRQFEAAKERQRT